VRPVRRWAGAAAALAALVAVTALVAGVPGAGAAGAAFTDGHADYAARLIDGALRSQFKDGAVAPPAWREPADVVVVVGDNARQTVPASGAPAGVGRPGESVWVIPQVQKAGVPWLGWNTEELSAATVDGPVRWSLDAVEGPGNVVVFQTGAFGRADVLFDAADGLPDARDVPLGVHAHGNWAFTRAGEYALTFTMSARGAGGGAALSDTRTLRFVVGSRAAASPGPAPVATTPATSTTPGAAAPAPSPGGTRAAAPVLSLPRAPRVRGRVLTLRLRLSARSRLAAELRRGGRRSAAAIKARTLPAGVRTVRIRLNRAPRRGRHTLRLRATATATGATATRSFTLRVPR
jgi:putative ABC transporter-associated repeat protein